MKRMFRGFPRAVQRPDSGLDAQKSLFELEAAQATREHGVPERRLLLAASAILITITGLLVHFSTDGLAGDLVGDALYAVLMYLVVSFLLIRRPGWQVAAIAIGLCVAIELFQLTGVPGVLAELFPPVRYLLGTTFNALDLVAYVVGALTATIVSTWRHLD